MGSDRPRQPHPDTQDAIANVADAIRSVVVSSDGPAFVELTSHEGSIVIAVKSIVLLEGRNNGGTKVHLPGKQTVNVEEDIATIKALLII
jgi:hypothetical protein